MARNVLACFAGLALFVCLPAPAKDPPEVHDLIVRSLAAGEKNEERLRPYVNRSRNIFKQLEPDGNTKSEEVKTFDDVLVDGFHLKKLLAKNDKPLTGADRNKEDSRVSKLVAQRKQESAEQRQRRLAEAKEKRDKDHRFTHELLDAFDFQLVGEDTINGRKAWVLEAKPHPGYKPKELKAQIFPHLNGRLWIDQEDLLWVKAEATAFEPFSVGFSALVKLAKGAHIEFAQSRLPDGVWVVDRVNLKANARFAMLKHVAIEFSSVSDNYRKVPLETRLGDNKDDF